MSAPGYRALHQRLNKTRGKASSFACVGCGEQAEEWSYDHSDPDELTGLNGRTPSIYSMDLTHYQPRCVPCHVAFDAPSRRMRRPEPPPLPTPDEVVAEMEAALAEKREAAHALGIGTGEPRGERRARSKLKPGWRRAK
jgi:hypothetical protein